eukprot:971197-Prymnesium_polylepis.2
MVSTRAAHPRVKTGGVYGVRSDEGAAQVVVLEGERGPSRPRPGSGSAGGARRLSGRRTCCAVWPTPRRGGIGSRRARRAMRSTCTSDGRSAS